MYVSIRQSMAPQRHADARAYRDAKVLRQAEAIALSMLLALLAEAATGNDPQPHIAYVSIRQRMSC